MRYQAAPCPDTGHSSRAIIRPRLAVVKE